MSEHKFDSGTMFDTPDGVIEIISQAPHDTQTRYSIIYHEVIGQPTGTIAETTLLHNDSVRVIKDPDNILHANSEWE